jgi:hypothetical protein
MNQFKSAFTLFLSLLVEAIPFLLLGVVLSSAILLFVDEDKLIARVPRNPIIASLVGSCIGFLFPVCECGNVPVARRLLTKGVPVSVAIAFLLAAPTINPVVIWSTWVAFPDRPDLVILRVVFSLAIATIIASIFSVQKDPRGLLQPLLAKRLAMRLAEKEAKPTLLQSGSFWLNRGSRPLELTLANSTNLVNLGVKKPFLLKIQIFLDNVFQELRELGGMLILGSAIAAVIQVFIPREYILSIGQSNIQSIFAMLVLAALVSICSTVDAFFALSFSSTFTTSSLLAFLVFGPTIDLKSITLMLSIFKPKIVFYIFLLAGQLTFLATLIHSYLF